MDARPIATAILERKLAACVNIVPQVKSLYWWKGAVEQDEEALLIAKTSPRLVGELEGLLAEIHPYETFELLALDVAAGSRPYLEWIGDSVKREQ